MEQKTLRERMEIALRAAKSICETAETESRDFTADERQQVAGYLGEAKDIKGQIKAAEGDTELRKQIADLGMGMSDVRGVAVPERGKSLGEQFTEAAAFKAWMKTVAPSGMLAGSSRGLVSPPVEFKHLFKTLLTGDSATSAGAFVQTDYTGIYEPMGRRQRSLLDLVNRRTTGSDTVQFVRQTAKVTQAEPVAEANITTYTGATGQVEGEKPEGAMAFEQVTATVKTIAVWIPATKRALSDASQLRGLIDQELREDVQEDLEDEIYDGDGTGEHFTGITETANVLAQAWDTDILTTTRKAKTALATTGRARPTAWVMNPADWETVELLQDGDDRYYYGGPLSNGEPRLWGIPVVESEAVTEGEAILGDWRKAILWDREQANIQVSDSHADFFIRNMVAILCELRAAFGVIRPTAFILVEMEAGT